MNTTSVTTKVTIISIWSKISGLEGKLAKRDRNVQYDVEVEEGSTPDETLENAYALTNRDDRPMGRQACSTTAGDIMVLGDRHYLVEGCGFRPITLAQSSMIQQLTSRDTSFGFEFMVKQGLLSL